MKYIYLAIITSIMFACSNSSSSSAEPQEKIDTIPQFSAEEQRANSYIIGIEYSGKIIQIGTGFAVDSNTIMTNAHVINAIINDIRYYPEDGTKVVAVLDGTMINGSGTHYANSYVIHPLYDGSTTYTYDFGLLKFNDKFSYTTKIASLDSLLEIKTGATIHTIGFPGETSNLNLVKPISTYKSGTISALRPFDSEKTMSNKYNNVIIQHDLGTTPGTSGSPIFDKYGYVIGIHNSGMGILIDRVFVSTESISFGIRIDQAEAVYSATPIQFNELVRTSQLVPYLLEQEKIYVEKSGAIKLLFGADDLYIEVSYDENDVTCPVSSSSGTYYKNSLYKYEVALEFYNEYANCDIEQVTTTPYSLGDKVFILLNGKNGYDDVSITNSWIVDGVPGGPFTFWYDISK